MYKLHVISYIDIIDFLSVSVSNNVRSRKIKILPKKCCMVIGE